MEPKNVLRKYFRPTHLSRERFAEIMERASVRRVCATCMMGRCGSTWLGTILDATKSCGRNVEHFSEHTIGELQDRFPAPADFESYLGAIASETQTAGVFSFQIDWLRLANLVELGMSENVFEHECFRFAYVYRRDIVSQAISFLEARKTGAWHRWSDAQGLDGVRVEPDAVLTEVRRLLRGESEFRAFFARHGIRPFELTYEDLRSQPQIAAALILRNFEVDGLGQFIPSALGEGSTQKLMRPETLHNVERSIVAYPALEEVLKIRFASGNALSDIARQRKLLGDSSLSVVAGSFGSLARTVRASIGVARRFRRLSRKGP